MWNQRGIQRTVRANTPAIDMHYTRFLFHLLSYYLANKRRLHVRSQGLEIPTLIEEK